MRVFLFLFVLNIVSIPNSFAQIDSSFWFAAPELQIAHGDDPIFLRMTSLDKPVTITISQPANQDFEPIVVTIPANSTQSVDLTPYKDQIEHRIKDSVLKQGLYIKGDAFFSCYYDIPDFFNGDIFALKGSNALGYQFTVPMQRKFFSYGYPSYTADFIILATQNNTNVTIIPSQNLKGHPAGVPYTIVLNAGETYVGEGATNNPSEKPGGTRIIADKKVVVTIKDDSLYYTGYSCGDTIGDQLIPDEIAGNEFIIIKGGLYREDHFYIYAILDSTIIRINEITVDTLQKGEYYAGLLAEPSCYITSSQPVHVFHITGFGCELGGAVVPGLKCTGSQTVSITRATAQGFLFNIIAPVEIIDAFSINGSNALIPASAFSSVPSTNDKWKFARINLPLSVIPVESVAKVDNSKGKFHMGVIHGDGFTTCRYGYFSDFASTKITYENYFPPFCLGAPVSKSPILIVSATDPISYQWYRNSQPNNQTGELIPGATDSAYTVPLIDNVIGITYYYVKVTGQCGVVTSPVTPIEITAPTEIIGSVKQVAPLCLGEQGPTLEVTAQGDGTLFYQWYNNSINSTAGATAITGAVSSTYKPSVDNSGAQYYFVEVTATCGKLTSDIIPVTVERCENFCTYTQGYFGNEGGKSTYRGSDGNCVTGSSTLNAIAFSIQRWIDRKGSFTLGGENRYIVIKNTSDDRKAVIDYLPNGGPNGPAITAKFDSLRAMVIGGKDAKNTLLAQTMTLGLNLGLNWGFGFLELTNGQLRVAKTGTCNSNSTSSSGVQNYTISNSGIIDYDNNGVLNVWDVYALANRILNGTTTAGVSLSSVRTLVGLLNEAFDECGRVVRDNGSPSHFVSPGSTASSEERLTVSAAPNPFVDNLMISFSSSVSGVAKVELFDLMGRRLGYKEIGNVMANSMQRALFTSIAASGSVVLYKVTVGKNEKSGWAIMNRGQN